MSRPLTPARTRLGLAIRERRGTDGHGQVAAAEAMGLPRGTLSRIERGAHYPNPRTARLLAAWLGWTVGQVFDAADAAVE